jgi:hypothetical protein
MNRFLISLFLLSNIAMAQKVTLVIDTLPVKLNQNLDYYPQNIRFVTGRSEVIVSKVEVTVSKGRVKSRSFELFTNNYRFMLPDTLFGFIKGCRLTFEAKELVRVTPQGDTVGRKSISQFMAVNIATHANVNPNTYQLFARYGGSFISYSKGMKVNNVDTLIISENPRFRYKLPAPELSSIKIVRGRNIVSEYVGVMLLPAQLSECRSGDRICFVPNINNENGFVLNIPIGSGGID